MSNFYTENYFLSKFSFKSPMSILKVKKGNVKFFYKLPFKYNYKNLIWFFFLLFHCKPYSIVTKKQKNTENEQTTLVGLNLSFSKNTFQILFLKIINLMLPNLESSYSGEFSTSGHIININFFNCLSTYETELIENSNSQKTITKFSFSLNIKFNTNKVKQIIFFCDLFNLPITYK